MGGDMKHSVTAGLLAILAVARAPAQTSFPMVTHATPVAVRRGVTTDVTVEGQLSFANPTGWLADHPGLTAVVGARPAGKGRAAAVIAKVPVGPDVPLGPHEFRVVTRTGLSSVGQLLVVHDPVVVETGNNNT